MLRLTLFDHPHGPRDDLGGKLRCLSDGFLFSSVEASEKAGAIRLVASFCNAAHVYKISTKGGGPVPLRLFGAYLFVARVIR